MPKLTTHALDVSHGCGAEALRVVLMRADGTILSQERLGANGRTESPLLAGEEFTQGIYVLTFFVGEYFQALGVESPFLDQVAVRFLASGDADYHVPLVFSLWAYQTYRGS